jgi:WD40 repeat protein
LVVGLQSGKVFVIDVQTYTLQSRSSVPQDFGSAVMCMASSANHFIIGCSDGSIRFLFHEGALALRETSPFAIGYHPPPPPPLPTESFLYFSPSSYSLPPIGSSVVSLSPSQSFDSMLVACADGRLLSLLLPSDLLLSEKDGWAGELELAEVYASHTAAALRVQALHAEAAAVSIDSNGTILMWSLLNGSCMTSVSMIAPPSDANEAAVAFAASSAGRLVAAGSSSGGIAMFDLSTVATRKCVLWSRLDSSAVVALAAHPSLPVFCVAFESNRIVFLSAAAAGVTVIGRTDAGAPVVSLHWINSAVPGHVLLLLRDATLLRLACPAHDLSSSDHSLSSLGTLHPLRVRLADVVPALTGDVSGMACRSVRTVCILCSLHSPSR